MCADTQVSSVLSFLLLTLQEAELARALAPGTIRLVFQPAEEAGGGGKIMTEQGVLQASQGAWR